jgi:Tol biopolymer transport system component/tRNA A-37 threonylcarbamoyl transferase component Bud32
MALAVGTRLGSCEVLGRIGAGGMGEVFRARDLKLGREVALKALPDAVAGDRERRSRFEREARLLASLNHPHIAAIHELLETDEGVPVLVLELVEGETLDVRIARGPLPLKEALTVSGQIAEALEAAHERGILHRDLKPSNVKLTREGKAKLLDFGLAKAVEGVGDSGVGAVLSSAETLTRPADATAAGAVLGTAPYMSPEQARGEAIDKRTDVWAFGCVLYEMLSGRRAFSGRSRAEAVAAVLEREPDWGALPEGTPVAVRALLRRCLQKDNADRLHDIADARIELKEALEDLSSGPMSAATGIAAATGTPPATRRRRLVPWAGGLLALGLAVALGVWAVWPRPSVPSPPTRLTFSPPSEIRLLDLDAGTQQLSLAPDGRRVAFVGASTRGTNIYVREVGEIESRAVPDTDGPLTLFFSPDGRWLGFAQGSRLMKLPIGGGPAEAICDIPGEAGSPGSADRVRGASWGSDGTIVFSPGPYLGLWRVPAEGGRARPLTTPNPQKSESSHRWPQVLPGGRSALFTISPLSTFGRDARIGVVSLDTGQYRVILEGTGFARYVSTGHILYAKLGSVLAVPFDVRRLAVTGRPVPVLSDVRMWVWGHLYAELDVSATGALVYVPGGPRLVERSLYWVDREGRVEPLSPRRRSCLSPRLSPDGRRLALTVETDLENEEVWVLDLERDAWGRVSAQSRSRQAVWSPDGRRLAFTIMAASADRVVTAATDGGGPPELVTETPLGLDEWSPGDRLIFSQQNPGRGLDIGLQPVGAGSSPTYLLANTYNECSAALSPDGRWMAYASDETGEYEVYVQRFPALGEKHRVSTHGGVQPRWSRDGRELFYRSTGDRPKIMAVAVQVQGGFRLGRPKALFDDVFFVFSPFAPAQYDVAPDGRFVFIENPPKAPAPRQIVLIPDFARELKEKLRAAGH